MRVLLRPVLVPELGLVIVKPGRESMPVFHNTRVLVEPEPKSMRNLPSGVVPAVRQPLAEDKTLLPFFSNERVIRAAGGAGALSDWLLRHVKSCQWPHGDYHHSETVIHRYGTGAMVLCWHCDNQLRDQTSESLDQLAQQNLAARMIDVIRHAMNGTQERELSLAELCWWAVCHQVADALPESVLRRSLGLPVEKIRSVYRESDIVPGEQTAISILKQRTKNIALPLHVHQQQPPPQEKTLVSITVDPESPAQYLQRQKPQREEMPVYTRWVKTQKCMTCGNQADDPHHIIGHGLGGMGTKADDLFVIPLCRKCHNELHAGVKDFEEKHGSQLLLLIRFFNAREKFGCSEVESINDRAHRICFALPADGEHLLATPWQHIFCIKSRGALSPGSVAYCSPAATEIKPVRTAGNKNYCRATG
ncbi:phage protein [Escherichia coli]|nr:phage protein [Escherichia coli]